MKIALLIEGWYPYWGGGQVAVFELLKYLSKEGVYVDVYTRALKDHSGKGYKKNEELFPRIMLKRLGPCSNFNSVFPRFFWLINVFFSVLFNKYDLIHALAFTPGVPGKLLSIFKRIPIVFSVHGTLLTNGGSLSEKLLDRLYFFLEKFIVTKIKYSLQTSVSTSFLKIKNRNKPIVIQNGVDVDYYHCKKGINKRDNFLVLFVGRFDPVKNVPFLLEAFACFNKKYPHSKLYLIGDGEERTRVEKKIRSLGLNAVVELLGYLEKEDIRRWYCKCDLFVLPSSSEGQPLTLLEAMSSKCIVAVTSVGDVPKIIDNERNGFIIPEISTKSIVEILEKIYLLDDREQEVIRKNARISIKAQHSWEKVGKSYLNLYEKLL